MKSKKCPICSQTKGKRDCLLQDGQLICSRCCAKTRQPDTCEDCRHFSNAEKHASEKALKKGATHFLAELNPEVTQLVDNALTILENGDVDRAEKNLTSLLEKYPRNHEVHYGMGCIHAINGSSALSIPYFQKSVEIFPLFIEAWHNLRTAYCNTGNAHHAIICARKVVELGDPKETIVIQSRKLIHDMQKHIAQDGLSLDQFIANATTYDLAFAHLENGEIEAAKKKFLQVLTIEKNHVQSHGNLGLCHALLGEKSKALAYLNKALELDAGYEVARVNKPIIEALNEGEKLKKPMRTVEFYANGMDPILTPTTVR
jgi:tetratricopeptide (TPR) repeat protein